MGRRRSQLSRQRLGRRRCRLPLAERLILLCTKLATTPQLHPTLIRGKGSGPKRRGMDVGGALGGNLQKLYFLCIDKGSDILEKLLRRRGGGGEVRHHYSCNASPPSRVNRWREREREKAKLFALMRTKWKRVTTSATALPVSEERHALHKSRESPQQFFIFFRFHGRATSVGVRRLLAGRRAGEVVPCGPIIGSTVLSTKK